MDWADQSHAPRFDRCLAVARACARLATVLSRGPRFDFDSLTEAAPQPYLTRRQQIRGSELPFVLHGWTFRNDRRLQREKFVIKNKARFGRIVAVGHDLWFKQAFTNPCEKTARHKPLRALSETHGNRKVTADNWILAAVVPSFRNFDFSCPRALRKSRGNELRLDAFGPHKLVAGRWKRE